MKAVKKLLKLTAIAFAVLIVLFFLSATCVPRTKIQKPTEAQLEIAGLILALKTYQSANGTYPNAESTALLKKLLGDNPQKTIFVSIKAGSINTNGEYLDPWGTPYSISFPTTNSFVISSAGKDKIFGDADDIIFNSASNDFVKP
jgi:type II secretory pathway pseudopilin PulG